jgi:hypothetical protein
MPAAAIPTEGGKNRRAVNDVYQPLAVKGLPVLEGLAVLWLHYPHWES